MPADPSQHCSVTAPSLLSHCSLTALSTPPAHPQAHNTQLPTNPPPKLPLSSVTITPSPPCHSIFSPSRTVSATNRPVSKNPKIHHTIPCLPHRLLALGPSAISPSHSLPPTVSLSPSHCIFSPSRTVSATNRPVSKNRKIHHTMPCLLQCPPHRLLVLAFRRLSTPRSLLPQSLPFHHPTPYHTIFSPSHTVSETDRPVLKNLKIHRHPAMPCHACSPALGRLSVLQSLPQSPLPTITLAPLPLCHTIFSPSHTVSETDRPVLKNLKIHRHRAMP